MSIGIVDGLRLTILRAVQKLAGILRLGKEEPRVGTLHCTSTPNRQHRGGDTPRRSTNNEVSEHVATKPMS